ncbi:hypothetical protein [Gloeobacter morelensis]|uniref:hypothetical protein n=1 Tax=Gloeobacter morelensis TaxID=2907343 RepID=UPI001E4FC5F0|nr:hypothetical protein [Gloeobacter morelensis]UFP97233.1 hypothetical protein ISF26_24230 [Gloeobacter morelensis MG652769]
MNHQEDPLAALREVVGDPQEQLPPPEEEPKPTEPMTAAQRKVRGKKKVADLTSKPVVALSLWGALIVGVCAGLFAIRSVVNSSQVRAANAQNSEAAVDWKVKAEKLQAQLDESEIQRLKEQEEKIALSPEMSRLDGGVPAPKSAQGSSDIPSPRPRPTGQDQPMRQRGGGGGEARSGGGGNPVFRVKAAQDGPKDARAMLSGSVTNTDIGYTEVQAKQMIAQEKPTSLSTSLSTSERTIPATHLIEARLISRVQFVGSQVLDTPVMAEVTKDVMRTKKRGLEDYDDGAPEKVIVLPVGSILVGKISKVAGNGFVLIAFNSARLPGEDSEPFAFQGIAVDNDGGVLVANAPRRPDPAGADALAIASSVMKGMASAGLTTVENYSGGFGGYGSMVTQSNAKDPLTEGIRQGSDRLTQTLSRTANEARQASRSGELDMFLMPGMIFKVMTTGKIDVPPPALAGGEYERP